jgi:hypothetical protein
MKTFLITVVALLCSCTFTSKVSLIHSSGKIYNGTITHDSAYKTGTLEIPESPYGELKGNFSLTSGGATSSTTLMLTPGQTPTVGFSGASTAIHTGKAYLTDSTNKVVATCEINAEYRSKGMGDLIIVGFGKCKSQSGDSFDLLLGQ